MYTSASKAPCFYIVHTTDAALPSSILNACQSLLRRCIDFLLSLLPTGCRADVSDIKFVVNFDFPNNTEDYVHRIGRTARAKKTGTAYSFFTSANSKQAKELIDLLKEAKQQVEPRLYEMMQMARQFNGRSKYNRL